ncbi:SRPBCC family protein [Kineococcus sp. SYSU DK004]|uniref:SRPBCC family protein n=1 Tax=Kineococcus sp. SYSU DK004 TaxID=3383125 RepID=UPI003D7D35CB
MTVVAFTATALFRAPAARVFDVLTDWPRQSAWVPATAVFRLPGPVAGPGERFVGRTGVGPLAFDDEMLVTSWRAPAPGRAGRVEVVKTGRLLGGTVSLGVRDVGDGWAQVDWTEHVVPRPAALAWAAAAAGPLGALAGRRGFELVLRAARADVEGGAVPGRS